MKKILRFVSLSSLIILLIIACLFWYIHSGRFIQRFIIPHLATAMGTEIKCKQIDFSLFSGMTIEGLELGDSKEPLLKLSRATLKYQFLPLLKSEFIVENIRIEGVTIHVIEDGYGASNTSFLNNKTSSASPIFLPLLVLKDLKIKNFEFKNLSYIYELNSEDPEESIFFKISKLNSSMKSFAFGIPFEVETQATINYNHGSKIRIHEGKVGVSFAGAVDPNFVPVDLIFSCKLNEQVGCIGQVDLEGRSMQLDIGVQVEDDHYRINHCNLSESFENEVEGFMSITGSFSKPDNSTEIDLFMKTENPGLLRLIGGLFGDYQVGNSSVNYSAKISHDPSLFQTSIEGDLLLNHFSFSSQNQGIPMLDPMDLSFIHRFTWDQSQGQIWIDKLDLVGTSNTHEKINIKLDQPLKFDYLNQEILNSLSSELSFSMENFDLLFLKPFFPTIQGLDIKGGFLNQTLTLRVGSAAKGIGIEGVMEFSDGVFNVGEQEITGIGHKIAYSLNFKEDFKKAEINKLSMEGWVANELIASLELNANYDLKKMIGLVNIEEIQVCPTLQELIPEKAGFLSYLDNLNCGGNIEIALDLENGIGLKGSLSAEDLMIFQPTLGETLILSPTLVFDTDYNWSTPVILNRNVLTIASRGENLGSLTVSGKLGYSKSSGVVQSNFDLEKISSKIPEITAYFPVSQGEVSSNLELSYEENENIFHCVGSINGSALRFQNESSERDLPPYAIDIEVDVVHKPGLLTQLNKVQLKVLREGENLLSLNLYGDLFPGSSNRKSELILTSFSPVRGKGIAPLISAFTTRTKIQSESVNLKVSKIEEELEEVLAKILETENGGTGSIASGASDPASASSKSDRNQGGGSLSIKFDFPEIVYDQITIKNLIGSILIDNKEILIKPLTCQVNEGNLALDFTLKTQKPEATTHFGSLFLTDIDLKPVVESLDWSKPKDLSGIIRELKMDFNGGVSSWDSWMESFEMNAEANLKELDVSGLLKKYDKVLGFMGLTPGDFSFDTAELGWQVKDRKIIFESFQAKGRTLKLLPSGSLGLGGNWQPDLRIIVGFAEGSLELLRKKNIRVSEGEDGFYNTDPLPFTFESWEKSTMIKSWLPSFAAKLLDLNPEDQAMIYGMKSVGKVIIGESTIPEALGGLLGVLYSIDNEKEKDEAIGEKDEIRSESGFVPTPVETIPVPILKE